MRSNFNFSSSRRLSHKSFQICNGFISVGKFWRSLFNKDLCGQKLWIFCCRFVYNRGGQSIFGAHILTGKVFRGCGLMAYSLLLFKRFGVQFLLPPSFFKKTCCYKISVASARSKKIVGTNNHTLFNAALIGLNKHSIGTKILGKCILN